MTIFSANKWPSFWLTKTMTEKSFLYHTLGLLLVVILAMPILGLPVGSFGSDMSGYLIMGKRLAEGESYIPPVTSMYRWLAEARSPMFSVLFALSFRLWGPSPSSALFITKFAALGNIILVYLILGEIHSIKSGIATASLIVTSTFMIIAQPVHLYIDQTMCFFMLLSLYCVMLSFDKNSFFLSILAGLSLGTGVLVKELAVIWLPAPIYFLLGVAKWKRYRNIVHMLGFYLGFGVPIVGWWLYFYSETGDIFLLERFQEQLFTQLSVAGDVIQASSHLFVLMSIVLFVLLLSLIYGLRKTTGTRNILSRGTSTLWNSRFLVWSIGIVVTAVFSIGLASLTPSSDFTSLSQIPRRVSGFMVFLQSAIDEHFVFSFIGASVVIILIDELIASKPGNKILFWISWMCVPLALMNVVGEYEVKQRYGMPIIYTGYMILGVAFVLLFRFSERLLSSFPILKKYKWNWNWIGTLALVILVISGIQTSRRVVQAYDYQKSPYFFHYNDGNPHVQEVAQWIERNIPLGARIATHHTHLRILEFYTDSKYEFQRWGSTMKEEAENGDFMWPYQTAVDIQSQKEGMQFYSGFSDVDRVVSDALYVQENLYYPSMVGYYAVLSQEDLVKFIQEFKTDYLLLTVGPPSGAFGPLETLPSYFQDHPAFHEVYTITWRDDKYEAYSIYVFRIDQSLLSYEEYPTVVSSEAWTMLTDVADQTGRNIWDLVELFEEKRLVIRPVAPQNFRFYTSIAEAYVLHNDFDAAAFEYHLALVEAPGQVSEMFQVARQWTADHPENAGPWLLLGDVYGLQGNSDMAQEAYQRAITAPQGSHHTYAAARQKLGQLSLAAGQDSEAIEQFEASLQLSIFGAAETRQQLLVARANLSQANGEIDQAVALYAQAFDTVYSTAPVADYAISVDFMHQLDQARVEGETASVRPVVFVMENDFHPMLFAHPPSQIIYTVQVPANARLDFSLALSPEVWKLGNGDGVQFDIYVSNDRVRQNVFSQYIDPKNVPADRRWYDSEVDISPWAGETVTVTFSTGCGPNDDCRYDWAGWGQPRIVQPVAYDFLAHLPEAEQHNWGLGETRVETETINYESRVLLFQQPSSQVVYSLALPLQSTLFFGYGMDLASWSPEQGGGVECNIYVLRPDESDKAYRVFHRTIDPKTNPDDRHWFDKQVDLSGFGGQTVKIIFETLLGPGGNASYNRGGWSRPVLVDETLPDHQGTARDTVGAP